jgi:hypothetical protein
MWMVMQV